MHIWFCVLKPRQAGCCRGEVYPGREPSDALGACPRTCGRLLGLSIARHVSGGDLTGLPAAAEVSAYRIVAEAVTNVPWQ